MHALRRALSASRGCLLLCFFSGRCRPTAARTGLQRLGTTISSQRRQTAALRWHHGGMATFDFRKQTKTAAWQSLKRKSLDALAVKALIKKYIKGKFASSSVRQAAEVVLEELADLESDVLLHQGNLNVDGDLAMFRPPGVALFIVDGDLTVAGTFESAMDPSSVVVVTGSLRARNVVNGGFLEVHGNVIAQNAALFLDNDPCSEIMADVTAPFLYTQYHSAKIHGSIKARLYTGDDDTLETKTQKKKDRGFVEETELKVKSLLSPALLKVLKSEMFESDGDDDDGWIDYVDSEKLVKFLRKGGNPLA